MEAASNGSLQEQSPGISRTSWSARLTEWANSGLTEIPWLGKYRGESRRTTPNSASGFHMHLHINVPIHMHTYICHTYKSGITSPKVSKCPIRYQNFTIQNNH